MVKVGFGYDIHRLADGRPLILGGVTIPFDRGLEGHSDADVLCHAIADALLGAAALGDIGEHFPDTDPAYKGASSIDLLDRVGRMVRKEDYTIVNVDATIIAEAPKLIPHKAGMIEAIADALCIDTARVSIKATTNEGFGPIGRGDAIAAYAVVSLDNG